MCQELAIQPTQIQCILPAIILLLTGFRVVVDVLVPFPTTSNPLLSITSFVAGLIVPLSKICVIFFLETGSSLLDITGGGVGDDVNAEVPAVIEVGGVVEDGSLVVEGLVVLGVKGFLVKITGGFLVGALVVD